jgi:hypothetical protein
VKAGEGEGHWRSAPTPRTSPLLTTAGVGSGFPGLRILVLVIPVGPGSAEKLFPAPVLATFCPTTTDTVVRSFGGAIQDVAQRRRTHPCSVAATAPLPKVLQRHARVQIDSGLLILGSCRVVMRSRRRSRWRRHRHHRRGRARCRRSRRPPFGLQAPRVRYPPPAVDGRGQEKGGPLRCFGPNGLDTEGIRGRRSGSCLVRPVSGRVPLGWHGPDGWGTGAGESRILGVARLWPEERAAPVGGGAVGRVRVLTSRGVSDAHPSIGGQQNPPAEGPVDRRRDRDVAGTLQSPGKARDHEKGSDEDNPSRRRQRDYPP